MDAFSTVWKTVFRGFYNPVIPISPVADLIKGYNGDRAGMIPRLTLKDKEQRSFLKERDTSILQHPEKDIPIPVQVRELELREVPLENTRNELPDILRNAIQEKSLYCPYKDCKKMPYKHRRRLWNHIGKYHCAAVQGVELHKNVEYVFATSAGKIIHFDAENSRNSIDDHENILVCIVNRMENDDQCRFYCPHSQCTFTCFSQEFVYAHIQKVHCSQFIDPEPSKGRVKNVGRVKTRLDVNAQNLLENGEVPPIENNKDDMLYCPYKACSSKIQRRCNMFSHLRKQHNFALLTPGKRATRLATSSGEPVDFDRESRNTLDPGERLFVTTNQK